VSVLGVTALHLAVQRGNIAAVRCLLSAGADVDVIDSKYGHTALFYALQRNDVTAVELLLSYGASRTGAPSVVVQPNYISKCSTDVLQLHQPAINHRHLPTCCPTGLFNDTTVYRYHYILVLLLLYWSYIAYGSVV